MSGCVVCGGRLIQKALLFSTYEMCEKGCADKSLAESKEVQEGWISVAIQTHTLESANGDFFPSNYRFTTAHDLEDMYCECCGPGVVVSIPRGRVHTVSSGLYLWIGDSSGDPIPFKRDTYWMNVMVDRGHLLGGSLVDDNAFFATAGTVLKNGICIRVPVNRLRPLGVRHLFTWRGDEKGSIPWSKTSL